jgi:hypothetical protein
VFVSLLLLLKKNQLVEQQQVFFAVVDGMGSVKRRGRSSHTMSALVCGWTCIRIALMRLFWTLKER